MTSTYAITYRNDPYDPAKFNALYAIPGDVRWRIAVDRWGNIRKFDTEHAAEAAAGHQLCHAINSQAAERKG